MLSEPVRIIRRLPGQSGRQIEFDRPVWFNVFLLFLPYIIAQSILNASLLGNGLNPHGTVPDSSTGARTTFVNPTTFAWYQDLSKEVEFRWHAMTAVFTNAKHK